MFLTQFVNTSGPFTNFNFDFNFTSTTGDVLDPSHENVILGYQHMIDQQNNDGTGCYNLDVKVGVVNTTHFHVSLSTSCNNYVSRFGISRMVFDKTNV